MIDSSHSGDDAEVRRTGSVEGMLFAILLVVNNFSSSSSSSIHKQTPSRRVLQQPRQQEVEKNNYLIFVPFHRIRHQHLRHLCRLRLLVIQWHISQYLHSNGLLRLMWGCSSFDGRVCTARGTCLDVDWWRFNLGGRRRRIWLERSFNLQSHTQRHSGGKDVHNRIDW